MCRGQSVPAEEQGTSSSENIASLAAGARSFVIISLNSVRASTWWDFDTEDWCNKTDKEGPIPVWSVVYV